MYSNDPDDPPELQDPDGLREVAPYWPPALPPSPDEVDEVSAMTIAPVPEAGAVVEGCREVLGRTVGLPGAVVLAVPRVTVEETDFLTASLLLASGVWIRHFGIWGVVNAQAGSSTRWRRWA